jgi:endonuclease YncB( thermonuclease family)
MFRTIAVVGIAVTLSACAQQHASSKDGKAPVTRVVDGDTIVVHIGAGRLVVQTSSSTCSNPPDLRARD